MEPDFGGYATKANLRCSDGRTIKASAFKHMDGKKVPLVWQHGHKNVENVLGHAILEGRDDGVYAYGYFNESGPGQHAKKAVVHGNLDSLSIYANQLQEQNRVVSHGFITEVSLVIGGANPGAKIDQVRIAHSSDPEDVETLEDEAIISHMGQIELPVEDDEDEKEDETEDVQHAAGDGETLQDIYDSLNDKQKDVVHYMIGVALDESKSEKKNAAHSDDAGASVDDADTTDDTDKGALAHQEGTEMRNVFEQQGAGDDKSAQSRTLSHSEVKEIVDLSAKSGSMKHGIEQFALKHGIENIEILFPDAKNITGEPELEKRRTEWVADVLAGTHKTPFSRIKTFAGDLTQDDARAKGYIKGHYKKEEWFGVTKRTTTPTTVYKKQKLDRDDMLDITDMNVVTFLKGEMRLMTEEEIAGAILIGDGRDVSDEDKVKDPMGASDGAGIRSILNDHELFVTTLYVNVSDADSDYEEVVDAVMDGMEYYKGTGTPTFYTTLRQLNKFKKAKDNNGRRYYETNAAVAEALGVQKIVTVELLQHRAPDVIGIIVNLEDYNTGTDRGGELTMFEDFDLDYNHHKYLMETRLSGALTKPKAALVLRATAANSVLAQPLKPTFASSTGVITIPTVTGVDYKDSEGNTLTAGAQTALSAGQSKTIYSVPKANFHFADTINDSWPFKRPTA